MVSVHLVLQGHASLYGCRGFVFPFGTMNRCVLRMFFSRQRAHGCSEISHLLGTVPSETEHFLHDLFIEKAQYVWWLAMMNSRRP